MALGNFQKMSQVIKASQMLELTLDILPDEIIIYFTQSSGRCAWFSTDDFEAAYGFIVGYAEAKGLKFMWAEVCTA